MDVDMGNDENNMPYNQKPKSFYTNNPTPYTKPLPTVTPTYMISKPPQTTIEIGYGINQPRQDFRFSLSDDLINFGPLSPTDFITRTSSIAVEGDPSYQYTITVFENHELQNKKNTIIPNTRCDDGTCSPTTASNWENTLTFGFGYHCENRSGNDCAPRRNR